MGVRSVFDKNETPSVIISSARTVNTVKPIYKDSDIITGIESENLSFSLQLMPINKAFTPEFINSIYKWFDVDDYAKLSFADDKDFYYMAMPFTEQSEATLYAGNYGIFSVSFVCDSNHGYTDIIKEINLSAYENKTINIENMNSISIYSSYDVPLFISAKFDGKGGDSFEIKSDAADNKFLLSSSLPGIRQIDIDSQSGIIICDNEANGYDICSGTDNLYINGNSSNIITFKNLSSKELNVYMSASVPLMGYKSTDYETVC